MRPRRRLVSFAQCARSVRVLGLALCLACLGQTNSLAPLPPGGHHVLFIGNSLTYVNNLPATVAALAASVGDTIRVQMVAKPDYALIDHLNDGTAQQVIHQGGWEFVILQQGSSSLPVNRDSLVLWTEMFAPYIQAVGATPALYMVWPTSDRLPAFDDVRLSYQLAAQSVHGVFIPAGQAWRTAWARDSTLVFYAADGLHPSALGTYLVALVMYERITGHDARLLPTRAVVDGTDLGLPVATVRLLQAAAHDTNIQYPA